MSISTNLHAVPLNLDVWAKATAGLSIEQEGVVLRALRCSWNAGHRGSLPATLPADFGERSRLLGTRNRALHAVVLRYFQPHETDASLLVWPWLRDTYADALDRYQRRKLAGVESGETRRRLSKERGKQARGKGAGREQCSNNVHVMLEQPKPNPVGVGSTNQPPTGEAVLAPALGGRAAPPDEPARCADQVTPEQGTAWCLAHREAFAELERAADAAMDQLNPEWRALPKRFGSDVRNAWLRERVAQRVLAGAGGPHA